MASSAVDEKSKARTLRLVKRRFKKKADWQELADMLDVNPPEKKPDAAA